MDRAVPAAGLPGVAKPASPARSRRGGRRLRPIAIGAGWGLASWALVIALWELSTRVGVINPALFPPPSSFVPYLFEGGGTIGIGPDATTLWQSMLSSFARVAAGLAVGVSVACTLGVAASAWSPVRKLVLPIVRVLAPVAPIAWIPLGLSLFGIGNGTAVFIVTLGVVFILTVATVAAIDGVDGELIKTAKSLGAGSRQLWTRVILPAAAPDVLTMIRLNFFAAWMAVLAAEMVGLRSGLGAAIIVGREQFDADLILIGIVAIGLCGFLADTLLLVVQRRLLWWGNR